MANNTIGQFIAALRKANGMTQQEVADRLNVSNKAVSRWERDECAPDLSVIPVLAEIFGVTCDELLRGERNNPDREVATSQDVANKQKAKSDKQRRLMLYSTKKKFTNLSLISIGLVIVGLIAAAICNYVFFRSVLGFCIASLFFVAAIICQICFTVSFRLLIDEEEVEHAEEIKKVNTDMVFASVKIIFATLLTWVFCLPLVVLTFAYNEGYFGVNILAWLMYGGCFAFVTFLLLFCIYKLGVIKLLAKKEIVYLDENAISKLNSNNRLLKKCCLVFVSVAVLLNVALIMAIAVFPVNSVLFLLDIINLLVCTLWYCIGTFKERKK